MRADFPPPKGASMRAISITTCWLLVATAVLARQGQPPTERPQPTVAYIGLSLPVTSLRELWDKTPIVVVGAVQNTLPPQVERDLVMRLQIFDIKEVLKDDLGVLTGSRRVTVKLYGGTVTVAGRDFITTFPVLPPDIGGEAILFLSPIDGTKTFEIPHGAEGFFPLKEHTTDIFSVGTASSRLPEFSGRREIGKGELIARLRNFRTGR